MFWKMEWKYLFWIAAGFFACFYLPVGNARFDHAILEALHLVQWYAQKHVLLCLIPAFFLAGGIGIFVSQGAVMKYLGPDANKILAYAVASVSGSVLSVCSCTMLPLFAGIYRMGAGLGPACVFLYSGPAINVLAIIMTARILGPELGIARTFGAIGLSIIIGLLMALIFRKEEQEKTAVPIALPEGYQRHLWKNVLFFASMIGILCFTTCGCSAEGPDTTGIWSVIYRHSGLLTSFCGLALGVMLVFWLGMKWWKVVSAAAPVAVLAYLFPASIQIPFTAAVVGLLVITGTDKGECGEWFAASWSFAKQMLPLLLCGILFAGLLLGRVGEEGLIPSEWIAGAVGGNSIQANFFASVAGALMYFATCTEVPFIQVLIGAGMGKGPALSLLLAGPALSLPSMLIINSVLGFKKTAVFVGLVIVFSMAFGMIFGCFCL